MAEDMSLLAELAADQNPGQSRVCTFERALAAIPDEADAFRAAIRDPKFTVASVARALERRGVEIPRNSLERHRKGRCTLCR